MALVKEAQPSRKAILNRIAAGLGGGYLVAATAAFGLSAILPGARVEAVVTAQLLACLFFVIVALWSFVPRRAFMVWLGVGGASLVFLTMGLVARI